MLKLAELNALDRNAFIEAMKGIFEHSPWIAARTEPRRPFRDRAELSAAMRETVMNASDDEKLALIRGHPDLVGDAALTAESQSEQAAAGLGSLTETEKTQFRTYNNEYRERFGFPFVICARENKKEAILAAFPRRLNNSPEAEIGTALREIFKIAELRLNDLVE
jgi:2-oxo-4-hydroxy-4-carboxy-5-ureidoimidazoline decarboxylase